MLIWALMFVLLAFAFALVGLGLDAPPPRQRATASHLPGSRSSRAARAQTGTASEAPHDSVVPMVQPRRPARSHLHHLAVVLAAGAEARARRARCSAARARLALGAGRPRSRLFHSP